MFKNSGKVETMPARRPAILRWLVVLFVLSMVLDSIRVGFISSADTTSRIVGIILLLVFIALVPSFRPRLSWHGKDLKWFIAFILIVTTEEFFRVSVMYDAGEELTAFISYAQLFVMFLIFRDITRDSRAYKGVLGVYALLYIPSAVLTMLDIPLITITSADNRVGIAGFNVNMLAFLYAIITVCIVTWLYANSKTFNIRGTVALASVAILVIAIARTGSRGGAVALVMGLLVTTAINIRSRKVSKYLLLLPLIIGGAAFLLTREPVLVTRMDRTLADEDTGYRQELTKVGTQLALAHPVIGYGNSYTVSLGRAVGFYRPIAAHNTYLQILLSFGLLGFVPFLLGIASVLKTVWRLRDSVWGCMWLAVLLMTLTFGVTAHIADQKYFWILVALAANASVMTQSLPEGGAFGKEGNRANTRQYYVGAKQRPRWARVGS